MDLASSGVPRIRPGSRAQVGLLTWGVAWALGRMAGTGRPNVLTTLGRHRWLFRRWLVFAGGLMPGGILPRADTELLILRVAHLCGSDYEWQHHERLGARAGLSGAEIALVRVGADAPGWTTRRAALLRAADELHTERTVSDETWHALTLFLDERELIEMCMLIGHYEMLAMTLNACRVQPDTRRS